jgi:SAM-dependent methyltransferase
MAGLDGNRCALDYAPTVPTRLNLGCGGDIRKGFVNVDIARLPGVDLVHDLNELPLPFEDESVSEIVCQDVLEHLDYVPLLRDLHRILEPRGTVWISVPHFTSRSAFADPTHRAWFSTYTWAYFTGVRRSYYFDFAFSRADVRITFERHLPCNRFLERFVNRSERRRRMYEGTPLRVFPAQNIEVILTK